MQQFYLITHSLIKVWTFHTVLLSSIHIQILVRLKEHSSIHQPWFFLSWENQWNYIFSINSQQILVNKVSNDRKCSITSYYYEKFMIFMKIYIFLAKMSFRSQKSEASTFWRAVKSVFHFKIIFKVCTQTNRIKEFWKSWFFNNNFNFFEKKGDFLPPPLKFFSQSSFIIQFLWKFVRYLYLIVVEN